MASKFGTHACARMGAASIVVALIPIFGFAHPAAAQPLGLTQALILAAERDIGRPVDDARADAIAAGARQAGVRPNPVVGVDLENFAGTGAHGLVKHAEATFYYQQQFERGDKRLARVEAANAELGIAQLRRNIRILDLFEHVQRMWAEAASAEAAVLVARDQLAVARAMRDEVAVRVQAARDPIFAGQRAETQVLQLEIALSQAEITARNANAALAAYLGGGDIQIDARAVDDVGTPMAATPAATTDLMVLEREREAASARIRVEMTRPLADLTLRGGVRSFGIDDEVALVVGGSLPLGTNDTNRGNIERAEAERVVIERQIEVTRAQRDREIVRLRSRLQANLSEVERLNAEVIPKAEATVQLVRDGFREGGFSYIDLIDAQRMVVELKNRRLEILKSYHIGRASLDRLTDRFANLIPVTPTEVQP